MSPPGCGLALPAYAAPPPRPLPAQGQVWEAWEAWEGLCASPQAAGLGCREQGGAVALQQLSAMPRGSQTHKSSAHPPSACQASPPRPPALLAAPLLAPAWRRTAPAVRLGRCPPLALPGLWHVVYGDVQCRRKGRLKGQEARIAAAWARAAAPGSRAAPTCHRFRQGYADGNLVQACRSGRQVSAGGAKQASHSS